MVVDASVWVSCLVAQDAHHLASRQWLHKHLAEDGSLVVPTLVLAEVAGAIARRTGASELGHQAAGEILRAPGLRLVALDPELGTEAARAAAHFQIRGADAVYVAVARALNIPLLTWDQELQGRVREFIEVLHPEGNQDA